MRSSKRKAEDLETNQQSCSSPSGHEAATVSHDPHDPHDTHATEVDDSGNETEGDDDENLFDDEFDEDYAQKDFEAESKGAAGAGAGRSKTNKKKKRKISDPGTYELHKLAINAFKAIHGHLLVTQTFVIPTNDPRWPEATWGMKFGQVMRTIRRGFLYADKHPELLEMGFSFTYSSREFGWERLKTAIVRYKEVYGDLRVPKKFVIPSDTDEWPKITWGLKLGSSLVRYCTVSPHITHLPHSTPVSLPLLRFPSFLIVCPCDDVHL